MEKTVYVLWKKKGTSEPDFKQQLLEDVSRQLLNLNIKKLSVCIDDERVKPAAPLRQINIFSPINAIISVWLDTSLNRGPIESVISSVVDQFAGYLVTESEPIVNTRHRVPPGEPTPGMHQVVFLMKKDDLDYNEYLRLWQESHTQVGIDTQSTFHYIQNVIVRPLTEDAPQWHGIVEEGFPEEAMTDQSVFFDAAGDSEKLENNRALMVESVLRFLDLEKINVIPMTEYVFKQ